MEKDLNVPFFGDADNFRPAAVHGTNALGVGISVETPNCIAANPAVDRNRYQMPVEGL